MEGLSFPQPCNERRRGLTICKKLRPLLAMLKPVYTRHEILMPPRAGSPPPSHMEVASLTPRGSGSPPVLGVSEELSKKRAQYFHRHLGIETLYWGPGIHENTG